MPQISEGDVLIMNTLLCHAPLENGGFGDRWVFYPYYGPLMDFEPTCSMKARTSILPNSPYEVMFYFILFFEFKNKFFIYK